MWSACWWNYLFFIYVCVSFLWCSSEPKPSLPSLIKLYQVVLNNLPPGPVHTTVGCFFPLNSVLTYALAIYPLVQVIDDSVTTRLQCDKLPSFLPNAVVRITIVLLTVVVAILVPNFAIIVTFIGCTVESLTGYILPFILHLKLKYKKFKIYQVFLDSVLLFFGVLLTIFGTTVVIKALIKFYNP